MLIQPFHCIIYLAFMNIVYELLGGLQWGNWINGVFVGECVFAIIVMLFIKQAEPIVRRIFGFDNAGSLGSALASGALLIGSIKTASSAVEKHNKEKEKSNKKGGSSRPQPSSNAARNTNNINNATQTNSKGTNTNATQNSNNTNGTNANNAQNGNSAGGQNGSGSPQNSGTQSANSSGGGAGSTPQNNQPGNRNLNTYRNGENLTEEEKKKERNEKIRRAVDGTVRRGFKVAGLAVGAMASDEGITGAMAGYGYGKAIGTGLGGKAFDGTQKVAKKVTRRRDLNKSTNNLIDEYSKLQSKMGWSDNLMYDQSERLLQINDLSKVSNPDIRSYGETLHKYREQFVEKYQAPDDMVLNAIDKIQTGELEKTDESIKRYTRKK